MCSLLNLTGTRKTVLPCSHALLPTRSLHTAKAPAKPTGQTPSQKESQPDVQKRQKKRRHARNWPQSTTLAAAPVRRADGSYRIVWASPPLIWHTRAVGTCRTTSLSSSWCARISQCWRRQAISVQAKQATRSAARRAVTSFSCLLASCMCVVRLVRVLVSCLVARVMASLEAKEI